LSDQNDPIQDLVRKRADLKAEVDRRTQDLTQLGKQVEALSLVMGLFQPSLPETLIFPQYRKETARLVFAALREAGRPMTAPELANRVLVAKRIPPEDYATVTVVKKRIQGSLAHHRRKGVLRCQKNAIGLNEWTFA